jgi:hypothetical protein
MIGIVFQFGSEVVETRIEGTNIQFRTSAFGSQFYPFESLHLSMEGVIKEFPDLEGDEQWREKAIERFKKEMKSLANENHIADYVVKDLQKFGYVPMYRQKQGHRVEVLKQ